MGLIKLDFKKHPEAQDMIELIKRDKGLSEVECIEYAINLAMYNQIIENGWAQIALDLWGHDDPERKWKTLKTQVIEIDLEEEKLNLIKLIMREYDINIEIAVSYFLIFTMDSLGYHI